MTSSLVRLLTAEGLRLLFWLSAACLGLAAIWPGQTLSQRGMALAYGFVTTLVSYGFFKLILTGLAWLGERFLGRIALWYILTVLYFGIVAVPLALISLPFQWNDLYQGEMTAPMFLASIPAGLSVALAAAEVIKDKYAEV